MYTWSHSINGILRKKRKQTIMLFPIEPTQSELHWTETQAMTKIMAAQTNAMVLSKTVELMYSHRSRHRERPIQPHLGNHTLAGYWDINGVKAHCLLDSRSEGVLLSPEFM